MRVSGRMVLRFSEHVVRCVLRYLYIYIYVSRTPGAEPQEIWGMFQQKTASNNCTLFLCQVLITNGFLSLKVVGALAAKHGRSASQILGKWQWAEHWGHREHRVVLEFALSVQPRCIQKGFQHIPKSEKRSRPQRALRPLCDVVQLGSRMEENARLFDFELDTEAPPPKLRTAIPCFERGMHLGRIWTNWRT